MDAWLNTGKIAPLAKPLAGLTGRTPLPMATKKKTPSTKTSSTKTVGNAKAGKKPAPAKKKAKARKKVVALECPAELIAAHKDGTLYEMTGAMNTSQIKEYCELCKVPRSGAKYKILALLRTHVEKASFASCCESGTELGDLTLEFARLSFARAHTKFCKLSGGALSKGPADTRWGTIVAAARGFDQVIYTAITGPNRKQYNGSRGETGIEANADVGRAVCEAFVCAAAGMSDVELDAAVSDIINGQTKCTPYGFDGYAAYMKEGLAAPVAKGAFDLLPEERQKKIEGLLC